LIVRVSYDRSPQSDFLEVGWLVEAGGTGEGGPPSEVASRGVAGVVHAEKVDLVFLLDLSPA
jgi:hypothetical protein